VQRVRQLIRKDIEWYLVTGYNQFIQAFLHRMKRKKPVVPYTKPIVDCASSLLINPVLLSPFIKLTFSQTSVFDIRIVFDTLDCIGVWFNSLRNSKQKIPDNIDYPFLFKGVCVLFESEHHSILAKALLFVYDQIDLFQGTQRKSFICNIILSPETFMRFFLHWCFGVRKFYHHLILYKLVRPQSFVRTKKVDSTLTSMWKTISGTISGTITKKPDAIADYIQENDNPPILDSDEYAIDMVVKSRIKSLIEMVKSKDDTIVDPQQQVYTDKALSEYNGYLQEYNSWLTTCYSEETNSIKYPTLYYSETNGIFN